MPARIGIETAPGGRLPSATDARPWQKNLSLRRRAPYTRSRPIRVRSPSEATVERTPNGLQYAGHGRGGIDIEEVGLGSVSPTFASDEPMTSMLAEAQVFLRYAVRVGMGISRSALCAVICL